VTRIPSKSELSTHKTQRVTHNFTQHCTSYCILWQYNTKNILPQILFHMQCYKICTFLSNIFQP